MGGHFLFDTYESPSFFGAIVALDGESDFPNSADLTTPDVLAVVPMVFPIPSAEVFGDVSVDLHPGWYALVFGSGLFGATGEGAAIANGVDIGDPRYFLHFPVSGWFDTAPMLGDYFDNLRFVVEGERIPEPASATLTILGLAATMSQVRRRSAAAGRG